MRMHMIFIALNIVGWELLQRSMVAMVMNGWAAIFITHKLKFLWSNLGSEAETVQSTLAFIHLQHPHAQMSRGVE